MPDVMRCPLCRKPLVVRYRVVESFSRVWVAGKRRRVNLRYHPIWWCTKHQFSVEVNRRGSRRIVTKRPGKKAHTPLAGSASGR